MEERRGAGAGWERVWRVRKGFEDEMEDVGFVGVGEGEGVQRRFVGGEERVWRLALRRAARREGRSRKVIRACRVE